MVHIASTAAVLNILVNAQTGTAQAQLTALDARLKKTAATATGTSGAMSKFGKGGLAAAGGFAALGAAAVVAGKQLYDVGKELDTAYDTIRTGTGATGKQLEMLKRDFRSVAKQVPDDFKQTGTAIADLNTRLGLTQKPLRIMARDMLNLSRITETDLEGNIKAVARAFVDWEVPVRRQTNALNGLFRLGQKSGASVAEIADNMQKFGSPLRTLGWSMGEAAAMFANFERAGVNMQTMVPGLKLAIGNLADPTDDLSKSLKTLGVAVGNPAKGLRQIMDLLSSGSNLTGLQKMNLAMDVFGKRAGADMAEAIKQGRFNLDAFIKQFNQGSDTIEKTARDTNDFSENMAVVWNKIRVAVGPASSAVFDFAGSVSAWLAGPSGTEAIGILGEAFSKSFGVMTRAITPLFRMFSVGKSLVEMITGGGDENRVQQMAKRTSSALAELARATTVTARARGRAMAATKAEARAESNLREARKKHGAGSDPVIAGEIELQRAKRKTIRLTERARKAEQLEGVARQIAATRLRESAVGEKSRISVLNRTIGVLSRKRNAEWKANGDSQRLREIEEDLTDKTRKRNAAQKRLNKTLDESVRTVGPQFAKSLRDMSGRVATMAGQLPRLRAPINQFREGLRDVLPPLRDIGPVSRASFGRAQGAIEGYANAVAARRRGINVNMRAMPPVQREATSAMWEDFQAKMSALDNGGAPRQSRRKGGVLRQLASFARGGLVPAAVSPGEMISHNGKAMIVPGQKQARDSVHMDLPVGAKVFTFDGQAKMAAGMSESSVLRSQRPHFAGGGIVEPTIAGGSTSARGLANKAIGGIHSSAKQIYNKRKERLAAAAAGAGNFNYTGPPADFKQLGNNSYVDSNTYAVATYLAQRFGSTISSDWRSVAENDAANGSKTSSHLRGTPANPGAFDFVAPSTAMQAFVGSSIAGVLENDIHDYGSGLHNHIAFFRKGGKAGSCGCGSCRSRKRQGGLIQRLRGGGKVGWGKRVGSHWDNHELASLAHAVGMKRPGLMAQIANGESTGNPNAVGNDAAAGFGNTFGYGLWQITSGHHDDKIAAAGGAGTPGKGIFHPVKNALAAKAILDTEGLGAWYADPRGPLGKVQPWLSRAIRASSGVGKQPAGGKPKPKQPNTGGVRPGPGGDKFTGETFLAKQQARKRRKILDKISGKGAFFPGGGKYKANGRGINILGEKINLAEQSASAESGPGGSELTEDELSTQVNLYTQLLEAQRQRRKMIAVAVAYLGRVRQRMGQMVKESGKPGSKLKWKRGAFQSAYNKAGSTIKDLGAERTSLVGLTGKGGSIFDTRLKLDELGVATTSEGTRNSELLDLMREQLNVANRNLSISQAQMPIFAQFMPKYHTGGIVSGAGEVPIMAQAGEGVFTRDQMQAMGGGNITVVIEDGAIDKNAIRVEVDGVLQKSVSKVRRSVGATR